ncbi:uncharacterized protein LOC114410920 [Glycine soja]|uniref:uncharacterized protein LOC114410920 n=1 Tax=Glycine soja TaxID=3848 RepID=UPI00103C9B86|nr:uncharacterized protein LOC114410920 [Glycine soja]
MEPPECPVCLQSFDERDAIHRVLSCGHSVCQTCLAELPQPYPDIIRFPTCTQLVKYPSHFSTRPFLSSQKHRPPQTLPPTLPFFLLRIGFSRTTPFQPVMLVFAGSVQYLRPRVGFASELTAAWFGELDKGGIFSFLMIGKGICEAVLAFHLEGLVAGCLGLSCFSFDELGGICVDLNEALMMGRKLVNAVSTKHEEEATCKDCLENEVFASPEVLYELLHKRGTSLDSGHSRYPIGYGSDVWSLACVLLRLLIGSALPRNTLKMKEENDGDISASYVCWVEKVSSVMEDKLGSEYLSLRKILCKCLDVNPGNLNLVDVRKCIQDMLVKPQFDFLGNLISRDSTCHCLVLGELCLLPKQSSNGPIEHELQEKESDSQPNFLQNGKDKSDEDFAAGSPKGMTEHKDLRGKSKKS